MNKIQKLFLHKIKTKNTHMLRNFMSNVHTTKLKNLNSSDEDVYIVSTSTRGIYDHLKYLFINLKFISIKA